jgi:hypothetical protein
MLPRSRSCLPRARLRVSEDCGGVMGVRLDHSQTRHLDVEDRFSDRKRRRHLLI